MTGEARALIARRSALVLGLVFAVARGSSAEDAATVSKTAVGLGQQGRYAEARAGVERSLSGCAPGDAGRDCRALLHYTLGFLAQLESESPASGRAPAGEAPLLDEAVRSYEAALVDAPQHGPTLANLAAVLQRRGDAWLAAQRAPEALASYEAGLKVAPGSESLKRRMVDAWTSSAEGLEPALAALRQWETSWPAVVRDGYVAVMSAAWARSPSIAERALVLWVDLLARGGTVAPGDLDALPRAWAAAAPSELREYVQAPWGTLSPSHWWLQASDRRDALARFALSLGAGFLAAGKGASWPERCWGSMLRVADPMSPRRVDLERELAMLYFHTPDLDPGGRKMAAVVDRVFDEKLGAYLARDLDAIQGYHTTLGLIFAAQKRWGTDHDPRSGLFQLRHALDAAAERSRQGAPPEPLPELRDLLAEGLAATGRSREAFETYVAAARGYLDTDDLIAADRSLNRAAEQAGSPAPAASPLEPLRALVRLRAALSGPAAPPPADLEEAAAWTAPTGLDPGFADRQRFKLLADAAARGPAAGRHRAAARALTFAVDKPVPLLSPRDLLRVEDVIGTVGSHPVKVVGDSVTLPTDRTLAVGGGLAGRPVRVSAGTVIHARLIGEGAPPEGAAVQVRGDVVRVTARRSRRREVEEYRARIARLPGVAAVVVEDEPD